MRTIYPTWHEANAAARTLARTLGLSVGIEKPTTYERNWTIRLLPKKENRYGWELRCEVVDP